MNRRQLLGTTVGLISGVAVSSLASAEGHDGGVANSFPPAAVARHQVAALPFVPTRLRGLSVKLITSHHENNYAGAVKNLNKVEEQLAQTNKDTPSFVVAALREKELAFTNSMTLHENYFGNLGGDGKASGPAAQAFGGDWEEKFRALAAGLGGGSGWVITALNLHSRELHTYGSGNHTQAPASAVPLLVLDMYEHAYAIDYGAAAAKYIDAFFQNVNWDVVNQRLARAQKAMDALRG
jgi:Fe-Mn family superoxide dismutase